MAGTIMLEDSIGKKVLVVEYIDSGHHQHRMASQGELLSVVDNMVVVAVEETFDDGETVDTYNPPQRIWFNIRASHHNSIAIQ